jgi:hypothetical protein
MTNIPDDNRIRVRLGALDDGLGRSRSAAWTTYLQVVADIEPAVLQSLMTPAALSLFDEYHRSGNRTAIQDQIDHHITSWCERWGFPYYYAHIPAQNTLADAGRGGPLPRNFTSDVYGNSPTHGLLIHQVQVADSSGVMRDILFGTALDLRLPVYRWDFTRETRANAFQRVMEDIRSRVDAALDEIEADALTTGHQRVKVKRRHEHFVWLARFQIKKDRIADIALELKPDKNPEDRERTIRRGVKAAATALER